MFTHTIDQLILDPKFVKTRLSQSYKLKEFAKTSNFLILKITLVTPHWGRVTHICISKLTITGSDNGLSSGRRQTIIWTNAGILLFEP